ncbi:MAG: D-sedoheptulose-7-phosphate isomerase [Thermodesulfobacteriota bacterium]
MDRLIDESLALSIAAKQAFAATQRGAIKELAHWMIDTLRAGNKLLLCGNGGSAADAQHLAAEFVNRFLIDRPPLAAIALTTDSSILTSVGNDFSFDDIFAKQIQAIGQAGDLLLAISTSGNSPNVIKAVEAARARGIRTALLTGKGGGKLAPMVDLVLDVPSSHTPAIQEAHLWVEHLLCQIVDEALYGKGVTP